MNQTKRFILVSVFLGVFTTIIMGITVYTGTKMLSFDGVYSGVTINGLNVSGKSFEQLKAMLFDEYQMDLEDKQIKLILEKKEWKLKYSDLNATFNFVSVANKAFSYGRSGGILERLKEIFELKSNNVDIKLKVIKDDKKLDIYIDKLSKDIEVAPQEPNIRFENGGFKVTPEVDGINVDKLELKRLLVARLETASTNSVNIPVNSIKTIHKFQELSKIQYVLGEYSTDLHGSEARIQNIKLSTQKMNGKILFNNEILSLNKVLGPRISENGFKKAPVIIEGKLVDGDGGGVCQVATTLYGATIRAKLAIEERAHHTIPSTYCPIGQDATIAGDSVDLKFKNGLKDPVYIMSFIENNKLFVKIFGFRENLNETVEIVSEVTDISPIPPTSYKDTPDLLIGEKKTEVKGRKGYKVNVYRITKANGQIILKELLSKNKYNAIAPLILVGTK